MQKASVIDSIKKFQQENENNFGPMFLLSIDPGFNNLGFAYRALKATLDPKSSTIQPTVYIDKQRFKSINFLEMR